MPNKINSNSFPKKSTGKKSVGTCSVHGVTESSTSFYYLSSVRVDNVGFTNSDILTVTAMTTKTGTNGTFSLQLYWNTVDSITGPDLIPIGFYTQPPELRLYDHAPLFQRRLAIGSITGTGVGTIVFGKIRTVGPNNSLNVVGTYSRQYNSALNDMIPAANPFMLFFGKPAFFNLLELGGPGDGFINGYGAHLGGISYLPINWTTTSYIILAGQNSSSSDYLRSISLQISN